MKALPSNMNEKERMPNIILIVADTVRVDHLSCCGYHRKTSPNIDRLAKKGVLFENAFATAEWSPPSHASIFTGKYPSYHKTMGRQISLNRENITLAEILNWNGYQTIGVSSNGLLNVTSGFTKGFQEYFDLSVPYKSFRFVKESPKDVIRTLIYGLDWWTYRNVEKIKSLLNKWNKKKPFFLFTNLFCCHAPHDPPRPFKKRFCSSLEEPKLYLTELLLSKICGHTGERMRGRNSDVRRLNRLASDDGQYHFMANEFQVSEEEWEIVKSWYDGAISYLDYRIGELVDFLCDKGIFEDTLLIILSDHGENFGDHGLASHQFCLYDSLIHVPLIMVYPDVIPRGKRISNLASLADVFPTVLDILKIKGFRDRIQGKSLLPFKDQKVHDFVCAESGETLRNSPPEFKLIIPKLEQIDEAAKCVRTQSHKYILYRDGKEELYNIQSDPFEKVDIAGEHPKIKDNLRKLLKSTLDLSYFGPVHPRKESEEIEKRLRALGYI
ncbi:sulfatase [Candidatus Bathyarchaeota archaeon]|nr:sulfatase [Candidatus Bathyarchaeota archaeon]